MKRTAVGALGVAVAVLAGAIAYRQATEAPKWSGCDVIVEAVEMTNRFDVLVGTKLGDTHDTTAARRQIARDLAGDFDRLAREANALSRFSRFGRWTSEVNSADLKVWLRGLVVAARVYSDTLVTHDWSVSQNPGITFLVVRESVSFAEEQDLEAMQRVDLDGLAAAECT